MPRDDFARLERRWRRQPMFLPRRRRLALWPRVVTVLALAGALALTLVDLKEVEGLMAGLEAAFNANANPSDTPQAKPADTPAAADRRLASPGDR